MINLKHVFVCAFVFSFFSCLVFGASQKKKSTTDDAKCNELLASTRVISDFNSMFEKYSVDDFFNPNPEKNLANRFPTTVMNAFQKGWYAANKFPPRTILDPTYRINPVRYWPAFHDGVKDANGLMIIGQHVAIDSIVDYLHKGARGDQSAMKMLLLRGPAGTGKTEAAKIIALLSSRLPQLTFDWIGLDVVPELATLMRKSGDKVVVSFDNAMQRSPIVLFPPQMQNQIVAFAKAKVNDLLGVDPMPFEIPDPQTKRILDTLVKHYKDEMKVTAITEDFYREIIRKHVVIRPKKVDQINPPYLIRYQGKDPQFHQLFFDENMLAMAFLSTDDPLAYRYTGKITKTDGGVLIWDEFFRETEPLRNLMLDTSQNRIVERGGAPSVTLDAPIFATSNDESIVEAEENGAAQAHLDRAVSLPMRLQLHPLEIAKTAIHTTGIKNFLMRELKKPDSQIEPADINILYPTPTDDGKLAGPDGRVAPYYKVNNKKKILIAPNAILLLALTVAGTHLVTDPALAEKYKGEIDLIKKNDDLFTKVSVRLQVLMDELQPSNASRMELWRIKELLEEGQSGISLRASQIWLSEALSAAIDNQDTLTPAVIDQTFIRILDSKKIKVPKELRAEWILIHNMVKSRFILPRLARDLNSIITGEDARIESLYEEIRREIIALGTNPNATEFEEAGGEKHPINRVRFEDLKRMYKKVNGRELLIDEIKDFHVINNKGEKFIPLVRTLESYLLKKEMDTATLDKLLDALSGRSGGPEASKLKDRVETGLDKMGYNRRALIEALRFVRDVQKTENP